MSWWLGPEAAVSCCRSKNRYVLVGGCRSCSVLVDHFRKCYALVAGSRSCSVLVDPGAAMSW